MTAPPCFATTAIPTTIDGNESSDSRASALSGREVIERAYVTPDDRRSESGGPARRRTDRD